MDVSGELRHQIKAKILAKPFNLFLAQQWQAM